MERLALLAVVACRIMLTLTDILASAVLDASRCMAVTLASAPYRQVGHGVVIALPHAVVVRVFVVIRVQSVEDNHDVCGSHPVL